MAATIDDVLATCLRKLAAIDMVEMVAAAAAACSRCNTAAGSGRLAENNG